MQKFISQAGAASRRAAEKMIADGRVSVNGEIVLEMGIKIDPDRDLVQIDGLKLIIPESRRYFLLYKPRGYLSTVYDPFGRPTVMDLFPPQEREGLFPVGRLDLDTGGLLLMTNDGLITNYLTHPRFMAEKTYHAWVVGRPAETKLQQLRDGFSIEDETYLPSRIKVLATGTNPERTKLEVILTEGKKRQIKQMFKGIDHPVISLKRVSLAFLNLMGLRPGEYRPLNKAEIDSLYKLAGVN